MKKHIFPITLILISVIIWVLVYQQLPQEVPIHWDINGNVDGYLSKLNSALFSNGMLIFLYLLFVLLPKIDPKKDNHKQFSKSYSIMTNSILTLIFVINLITVYAALGYNISVPAFVSLGTGVLFIIIGYCLQTVKVNYFVGIRTPWTLSSENVWVETHRLSSKLFIIGGFAIVLSAFLPSEFMFYIVIGFTLFITFIPTIYSYILFKKETKV